MLKHKMVLVKTYTETNLKKNKNELLRVHKQVTFLL